MEDDFGNILFYKTLFLNGKIKEMHKDIDMYVCTRNSMSHFATCVTYLSIGDGTL